MKNTARSGAQILSDLQGGGASALGMSLHGHKELDRLLRELEPRVYRKVVRSATAKAMTPVLKDARQYARAIKQTGLLAESLGKKTKTFTRAHVVVTIVGPRKGYKRKVAIERTIDGKEVKYQEYRNPVSYAHLVHGGTKAHNLGTGTSERKGIDTGGARHPGAKAQPYLSMAFWKNERVILDIYRRELGVGVEKEAMRLAK